MSAHSDACNYPIIYDAMMSALTCLELTKDKLRGCSGTFELNTVGLIAGIIEAEEIVHKAIDLAHVAEFAEENGPE